jgi:GTP-binding protein Era
MAGKNKSRTDSTFKSGFVTIIGAPNVGKSTLLNRLLGEKISITSKKPQTTRNRILGILHQPTAQLIFMDTPGMHKSETLLNTRIVETALSTLAEADIILILIDVAKPDVDSEEFLIRKLEESKQPVILALNKIDLMDKSELLAVLDRWAKAYPFKAIVPISAMRGTQVDTLIDTLLTELPEGPPYFPDDTLTDLPERFIVAEMIREKVFRLTGEEIPYSTAVTVDSFKEEKNGALIRIHATVHMERSSQKGIIIGKKGAKLKQIGQDSRETIERFLGTKVFLKLFVRVEKNWSKDSRALRKLGY